MTTAATAVEYDPFDPDFYPSDPFAVYRWMRDEAPVYWSEKWGFWVLTRFSDVRAAALDAETFLASRAWTSTTAGWSTCRPGRSAAWTTPATTRCAGSCSPLPAAPHRHEDGIRRVVRELVASWQDAGAADVGRVDIAQELAWPMPFDVFFYLMGFPGKGEENPASGRARQLERWIHELKDRIPGTPPPPRQGRHGQSSSTSSTCSTTAGAPRATT